MFNYVPIKHKQMSFVSNGGKFKLYIVLNGLIFPTPTQPRISFEGAIYLKFSQCYRWSQTASVIFKCIRNVLHRHHFLQNIDMYVHFSTASLLFIV
jgi:hypothetical protein